MVATFAAGALVFIGILFAVLGLFVGGSLLIAGVGLASIVLGGLLAILAGRTQRALGLHGPDTTMRGPGWARASVGEVGVASG